MHPAYERLYKTNKRYILCTGGRGSLKSSNVQEYIIDRCRFMKGQGVLYTRYTMTSAEKSIIPEFKIVAERMGVEDDFEFTNTSAINKTTGSRVLFSGIKTSSGKLTANLKSIAGINIWVIEEGEDFDDAKTFNSIDDSIRSAEQENKVIWIQNPSTKEHFAYNEFIDGHSKKINVRGYDVTVSDREDVEHIHTTYHIGQEMGYLSDSFIAKAEKYRLECESLPIEKQNKTWYYTNYIGGWLEQKEGVVFEKWSEGVFNDRLPYLYGLDFGYHPDPLAMIKIAVDKKNKKIYAKQCIYSTKLSEENIVDAFKNIGINKNDLIVSDINEPRTSARLRKLGINIQNATKGKGSIAQDIRDICDYELIVDPSSEDLKKELNNYTWNDKKASIPIDDYNHLLDALRYAFRRYTTPKISARYA